MCGIDDFEILQHFCRNYNGRIESKEEMDLNDQYQNLVDKIAETEKAITACESILNDNMQKMSTLRTIIEQRETEFVRSGGLPPEEVKILEKNVLKYDKEREVIAQEIKSFFEDLMPFFIMKDMISQLKQQIKYEEKASIHEYIINMLSKESVSYTHLRAHET